MLTVIITITDTKSPIAYLEEEKYYTAIKEENYYQEVLKLLFWLREHKDKQISNIEYRNY